MRSRRWRPRPRTADGNGHASAVRARHNLRGSRRSGSESGHYDQIRNDVAFCKDVVNRCGESVSVPERFSRGTPAKKWSGRVDLNHRPPGPEPGALARLSHAPTGNVRPILFRPTWTYRISQLPQVDHTLGSMPQTAPASQKQSRRRGLRPPRREVSPRRTCL
jgi:hypothetical protein